MNITYQISHKICTFLIDNQIILSENSKFYLYCFEFVLDNLLFNTSLLILGFLFSVPLETVIYIITIVPMKMFAGGAHANSRTKCSVISYSVFLGILYVTDQLAATTPQAMINMLFFFSLSLILLLTPVDTQNKRIPICLHRQYKQKCLLCCLFVITIYMTLWYYNYTKCCFLATICMMTIALNQIIGILINNTHRKETNNAKHKNSNMR